MKINIHITTYIFLLISFFSGYFEYMYLLLLIIFIHESGHLFFSLLIGVKASIIIYPFGGIAKINENLNISTNKELFILLGGIIFQIFFYLICLFLYNNLYLTTHVFNIIKRINYILISFNFMLCLPLDGGRLLNIILDKIFPYKISSIITIVISFIFVIIFLFFKINIYRIILSIFLIKYIFNEINNFEYKYNTFLLERYLYKYNFDKIRIIKNINYFKRDYNHIINNTFESVYLHKLFDTK